MVMVTPADLHDAAAAKEVLFRLPLMHPEITIVWADSAYAGKLVDWAKQHLNLTIKPVSRPKDASGFVVLPRRWVVEVARLDDARPPPREGLRTAHPTLRNLDHLGGHHPHDPPSRAERRHPQPAEETARCRRLAGEGQLDERSLSPSTWAGQRQA
jgi:hypothetical protein